MRTGAGGAVTFAVVLAALAGCHTTVDSLGYNGPSGIILNPLRPLPSYPNKFLEVLGKSDAEIAAKIAATFAQLFHGDPIMDQPIYFPVPDTDNQAYIQDVFHDDVRTAGIGYGMIITVELDKRDEFDHLWTYAKTMMPATGSAAGYFVSSCSPESGVSTPCLDPFGMEQFVMALLFAHDRWGSNVGGIDYASDVRQLLDVMRHKEDQNGGLVDGVTNIFDQKTGLAFELPNVSEATETSPAIEMPAYYDLWAQATGDPFWSRAAAAGRAYWKASANPTTGLMPVRAQFDGTPSPGWDTFAPEGYRAQLNMVLDQIWSAPSPSPSSWNVDEADRLLKFFIGKGSEQYVGSYSLDGNPLTTSREPALTAINGITASISTLTPSTGFIEDVWNLPIPTGTNRYFPGILDLLALLVLSGQYQVH